MKLPNIPKDKLEHFFYGAFSATFFIVVCLFFGFSLLYSLVAQVLLWGVGKELLNDKLLKRGNPEWADFAFSMMPLILIYLTILFK
jgi:ABC-type antimicrobial peptide transport system permease subunit